MLELNRLTAGYGKQPILREISLSLPKGSFTAVAGPNGAGKSTLLKAIVGLLPPLDGAIFLNGTDLATLPARAAAKQIAYLPQGRQTPDMTVEQLVLHGRFPHLRYPRQYGERDFALARAALERLGICDLADRPLSTLSGGMRQKVYLAMAVAQDTDFILLDEPTTYLDIAAQSELMAMLRDLAASGKGILAVLHDLPLAFTAADRIALLDSGRLIACDTPAALSQTDLIPALFGVELRRADDHYYYRY